MLNDIVESTKYSCGVYKPKRMIGLMYSSCEIGMIWKKSIYIDFGMTIYAESICMYKIRVKCMHV